MQTKVLIIAIIKKGDAVLMRKKPDGSPPYVQTWYLFGGELTANVDPEQTIKDTVRGQTGIEISFGQKFSWDSEVKKDLDGVEKQFVYLDVTCDYISGQLVPGAGIEKLEWAPVGNLDQYDIVPPSVEVFKKLGWIK